MSRHCEGSYHCGNGRQSDCMRLDNYSYLDAKFSWHASHLDTPYHSRSYFYNNKGNFSIVLLAVVDANYKFIMVDIGCNGRNSDGVLKNSNFGRAQELKTIPLPRDRQNNFLLINIQMNNLFVRIIRRQRKYLYFVYIRTSKLFYLFETLNKSSNIYFCVLIYQFSEDKNIKTVYIHLHKHQSPQQMSNGSSCWPIYLNR